MFGLTEKQVHEEELKAHGPWQYIPELLVVGASDTRDNKKWAKSITSKDGALPELYAPGAGILTADGDAGAWPSDPPVETEDVWEKMRIRYYKDSAGTSDGESTLSSINCGNHVPN